MKTRKNNAPLHIEKIPCSEMITPSEVITPLVHLTSIHEDGLKDLARIVTRRQKNEKFMRYLKERPLSMQQNRHVFLQEIQDQETHFLGIEIAGIPDLVGFLLFHNFEESTKTSEIGFRISPNNQSKGVCTHAVKRSLHEIFVHNQIENVIGWHSAFNRGSFGVFKKGGFHIEKFVPEQTFLPNINRITDDIKRVINKTLLQQEQRQLLDENSKRDRDIIAGLAKHQLIL